MINSLLYAKLPPHLKRSINTAYLENGTYEEIIQHLERELELNGLEGDNAPAITISATQNTYQKTQGQDFDISNLECRYCKEKGHFVRDCIKLKRKKERDERNGIDPNAKRTFPPCEHCGLTNHPSDKCRRIANTNSSNTNNRDQPSTSRSQPPNQKSRQEYTQQPFTFKLKEPRLRTPVKTPAHTHRMTSNNERLKKVKNIHLLSGSNNWTKNQHLSTISLTNQ